MCLAIPTQLIEIRPGAQAIVELGGIRKEISIALVPDAAVGDYVIVHVGHAIGQIDPEEAARTLALFGEMAEQSPFALSLSKGPSTSSGQGFDGLSPNGAKGMP